MIGQTRRTSYMFFFLFTNLKIFKMQQFYEKRVAIIELFKVGHSGREIRKVLASVKLKTDFVNKTIKRYKDTGDIVDRPRSGRPRNARTKRMVRFGPV